MSTSITAAFIGDYSKDVHHVFQREGGMLKDAVYVKDGIVGSTAYFENLGTGVATTKSRHGEITPMNVTHTQPSVTLVDFYAGDWSDLLDEAKTNIEVRMNYAKAGAYALGRKCDEQIFTALNTTSQTGVTWLLTNSFTIRNSLLAMTEALWGNGVPNDGNVYAALSPRAWSQAMTVEEFSSADYVGPGSLAFTEGAPGHKKWKDWMGTKWCMHTAVPGIGTTTSKNYIWHRNAVGYGVGKHAGNIAANEAVAADITWHGDRASYFVNHSMSGGALLIDDTGVIEGTINDTTAIVAS